MKKAMLLSALAVLVLVPAAFAQGVKKYDVKSGIVTYDYIMMVGKWEMKSKFILYFDDYGAKECREAYPNEKLEEILFVDGMDMYSVDVNKKTASKTEESIRSTELMRIDYNEIGTQEDRDSGKVIKLPRRGEKLAP
jgi:hypothetical protein